MVDTKHAVAIGIAYFRDVMNTEVTDIVLEEIELTDDERFWLITLSALVPETKAEGFQSPLGAVMASTITMPRLRRIYRIFKVNTDTGQVVSMKIRHMPS